MKAIIFNSGLGKRMEDLTKDNHKSMVKLSNGETIYERQLRILSDSGIKDIVVTVGPFKEQLIETSKKEEFNDINFTFVENPIYDQTNYIYSMYLAKENFDDDFMFLHGDLVFDEDLVKKMLKSRNESLCLYNEKKHLPEKDFKGRIKGGNLKEVSINIFDEDCYAFQPMYKLSKEHTLAWSKKVEEFIEAGNDKVYAENALNEILSNGEIDVIAMSYRENYIDEVDTKEDLDRVSREIADFEQAKSIEEL